MLMSLKQSFKSDPLLKGGRQETLLRHIRQLIEDLLSVPQKIRVTVRVTLSVVTDCRNEFFFLFA